MGDNNFQHYNVIYYYLYIFLTYLYLIMYRYCILYIILTIFHFTSCDVLNPGDDEIEGFLIDRTLGDTTIYLSVNNERIPIVLSIPDCGKPPYAAVVILHGSGGMWDDNIVGSDLSTQLQSWRDLFKQECVISAYVDSYTPRGTTERVGEYRDPPKSFEISAQFVRPNDAYAALDFLWKIMDKNTGTLLVEKSKVGLLGFSHGATAVENTIFDFELLPADWKWSQKIDNVVYNVPEPYSRSDVLKFAAAVSYYPGSFHNGYYGDMCNAEQSYYVNYCPLLLNLAALDPLTENSLCFFNSATTHGGHVEYTLYEGAEHSFDEKTDAENGIAREAARLATIEWFRKYLEF